MGFAATNGGTVIDFLAETALVADVDRMSEDADRVLMLTAHNAKGLEFPVVIVAGLEEGLFPHGNSIDDPDKLEEERRLFYVAVTRARDQVFLTAAAFRRRFDGARGGTVSRFVDEIPGDLLEREEPPRPAWSVHERGVGRLPLRRRRRLLRRTLGRTRARARGGGRGSAHRVPASRRGARGLPRELRPRRRGRRRRLGAKTSSSPCASAPSVKKVLGRFLSEGAHDD